MNTSGYVLSIKIKIYEFNKLKAIHREISD